MARYSFIQLSELEQYKLAEGFNTVAQDSHMGPLSQESEALPLSHCTLHMFCTYLVTRFEATCI